MCRLPCHQPYFHIIADVSCPVSLEGQSEATMWSPRGERKGPTGPSLIGISFVCRNQHLPGDLGLYHNIKAPQDFGVYCDCGVTEMQDVGLASSVTCGPSEERERRFAHPCFLHLSYVDLFNSFPNNTKLYRRSTPCRSFKFWIL